jgi:AraC-like DNA-binding protein/quercetin dioxygenase-like cupin family protein
MTISAPAANDRSGTAKVGPAAAPWTRIGESEVDMRGGAPVRAGTFAFDGDDTVSHWHTHDLHQVEYAFQGVVEVEADGVHYLLPPQQAIWIPAGLSHRTTLRQVRTVAVFFHPDMVSPAGERVRVLAAAPVIREMILYAARWPIGRAESDATADGFFDALALLVLDWLDCEAPLCLPTSTDAVISAVMAYTADHLASVTAAEVCRAVGLSERTLRRRFQEATTISWRQFLLESRLLRAMSLLAEPGLSVIDVATAVGFESASAFSRAFARYIGETPRAYRLRILAGATCDTPTHPATAMAAKRADEFARAEPSTRVCETPCSNATR